MTESQIPTASNPIEGNNLFAQLKSLPGSFILSVVIAIAITLVLLYNALFPDAFWQSRELEQNQAKWESRHVTHYQMSLHFPGYMPLIVEVKDGQVISMTDANGKTVSRDDDIMYYHKDKMTIPGLFSYTHQTIWEKPPAIDVYYDPNLGYPASIYIDPYKEPCCQDFTIIVRDLRVLP